MATIPFSPQYRFSPLDNKSDGFDSSKPSLINRYVERLLRYDGFFSFAVVRQNICAYYIFTIIILFKSPLNFFPN